MAQIPNSIGVSAPIAPYDTTDTYPTHFAEYGKGGYFTVPTLADLLNTPVARLEEGSFAYVRDEAAFYLYRDGQWEQKDIFDGIAVNNAGVEVVKPEELPEFLESIDRGSKYIIYVDPNHANSSDAKDNTGNSPLRPFRTIERACLQAARKSFNPGGTKPSPNDFAERVTIYLAPATYYVNNGLGGNTFDTQYNKRQDASLLINANKDWLITRAYTTAGIDAFINTVTANVNERSRLKLACKRDLNIFISAIANDVGVGGWYDVTYATNTIKPSGTFIAAYNSADERSYTVTALNKIRDDIQAYVIKNTAGTQGGVTIPGIVPDVDVNNPCASLSSEVANLVGILTATLNNNPNTPAALESASKGVYSISFPETGEPTPTNLQSFNNAFAAGIILPRGISIVGADLRKVIIKPKYVPSKDGSEGQSAIFRMTGGNFFSGFTILDSEGVNESHHNLSCFEFCKRQDLQDYYDDVVRVFKDNKEFNRLFDSSNLLYFNTGWLNKKIVEIPAETPEELDYKSDFVKYVRLFTIGVSRDLRDQTSNQFKNIVGRFKETYIDSLDSEGAKTTAITSYTRYFEQLYLHMVDVISNRANVAEGGYIDLNIPEDQENPTNPCQNVQAILYNFYQLFEALLEEAAIGDPYTEGLRFDEDDVEMVISENEIVGVLGENTVAGASPYIYSATLRSKYGMCGVNGDGRWVDGFKSYLVAQFTVISLQTDNSAFISDELAEKEINNKRYRGSSLVDGTDFRHYGYKVSHGAYAQLVSCFCIGPAQHYLAESGGEFSITNSTSNFGDVSVYSKGFVDNGEGRGAYPQDQHHKVLGLIRPKGIDISNADNALAFTVGTIESYQWTKSQDPETAVWSDPLPEWKGWANDPQSTPPNYATNFLDITYIKLTFSAPIKDLGNFVEYELDGDGQPIKNRPILEYVYAAPGLIPRPTYETDPALGTYNDGMEATRKAKVEAFVDDRTIIIREHDYYSDPSLSTGEWFERESWYYDNDGERIRRAVVTSSLVGRQVIIKRFVDNRTDEEKRFYILVGRGKNGALNSRIPPVNFILRKQTGVISAATQPFAIQDSYANNSAGIATDQNKLFYINSVLPFKDVFQDDEGVYQSLPTALKEQYTKEQLYAIEVLSANNDAEFRAQTDNDIFANNVFYMRKDAEVIVEEGASNSLTRYLHTTRYDQNTDIDTRYTYYSRYNMLRVMSMLLGNAGFVYGSNVNSSAGAANNASGNWSLVPADTMAEIERLILVSDFNNPISIEFNKPSTARVAGQTWEYLGYYNYDTGVPQFQEETLGDSFDEPSERSIFRLEKLQKFIAGGRIYATGMDELGNIIEGNNYRDLKTGKTQTIVRGTSVEVLTSSETFVPEVFKDVTLTGSFTASAQSTVNLTSAKLILPTDPIEGTNVTYKFDNIVFEDNPASEDPGVVDVSAIQLTVADVNIDELTPGIVDLRNAERVYLPIGKVYGLTAGSDPITDFSVERPGLAKKSTPEEIEQEAGDNYITASQLQYWRNFHNILTENSTVIRKAYIGFGWADDTKFSIDPDYGKTVTWAEFKEERDDRQDENKDPIQVDDPTKPFFRVFIDFAAFASYSAEFSSTDTLDLGVSPGIYDLNGLTFNCGIRIKGATQAGSSLSYTAVTGGFRLNTGTMGRYDGCDGSDPTYPIKGIKSVILCTRVRDDRSESTTEMYMGARPDTTNFYGVTNEISNVIFWGPAMYAKQMREEVFGHEICGTEVNGTISAYDPVDDVYNQFYNPSSPVSLKYRMPNINYELLTEAEEANRPEDQLQNGKDFSHPPMSNFVTTPWIVDDVCVYGFYRHRDYKTNLVRSIGTNQGGLNRYYNILVHSATDRTKSCDYYFEPGNQATEAKLTIEYCIIGPGSPRHSRFKVRNFKGSIATRGITVRGNDVIPIRTNFKTKFGSYSWVVGDYQVPGITATRNSDSAVVDLIEYKESTASTITITGSHTISFFYGAFMYTLYGENCYVYAYHSLNLFNLSGDIELSIRANGSKNMGGDKGINYSVHSNCFRFEKISMSKNVYETNEGSNTPLTNVFLSRDANGNPIKTSLTEAQLSVYTAYPTYSDNDLLGEPGTGIDFTSDLVAALINRGPILNSVFVINPGTSLTFEDYKSYRHAGTRGYEGTFPGGAYYLNRLSAGIKTKQRVIFPYEDTPSGDPDYINVRCALDMWSMGAIGTRPYTFGDTGNERLQNDERLHINDLNPKSWVQRPVPVFDIDPRDISLNFGSQYHYSLCQNGSDIHTHSLYLEASSGGEFEIAETQWGITRDMFALIMVNLLRGNYITNIYPAGGWGFASEKVGQGRYDWLIGSYLPTQTHLYDEAGLPIPIETVIRTVTNHLGQSVDRPIFNYSNDTRVINLYVSSRAAFFQPFATAGPNLETSSIVTSATLL